MPMEEWESSGVVSLKSHIELEIEGLNTASPSSADNIRIDAQTGKAINVTLNTGSGSLSGEVNGLTVESTRVTASVELTSYSITLTTIPVKGSTSKKFVTLALTGTATVTLSATDGTNVTGTKATLTEKDIKLDLNTGSTPSSTPELKVYSADVTANVTSENTEVTITLKSIKAEGTIESAQPNITEVIVTIPVKIDIKETGQDEGAANPEHKTITSVQLILPVPSATGQNNLTMPTPTWTDGTNTLNINVSAQPGQPEGAPTVQTVTVTGKGFYPNKKGYCIYSVRDSTATKDIWANIGGKCEYVACYYKNVTIASEKKTQVLLILYFRSGGSPERKYFGTDNAGKNDTEWKTIPTEDKFIECIKTLAKGEQLSDLQGTATPQYNRDYDSIRLSPVWFPLVMHGMAVGSFGSIFPNLIPKTLTCPKTTRNLTVMNMFIVPLPHIINLALAENGWPGCLWPSLWSLYIFYILSFLHSF